MPAGYGTLQRVNLAVIAAFAAAAISLVNVVLTARLTRGSQFRQWQREEARPITARILTLSGEARSAWHWADAAREEALSLSSDDKPGERAAQLTEKQRDEVAAGVAATSKLRDQLAQLNLIATPSTRRAADSLVTAHMYTAAQFAGFLRADIDQQTMDQLTSTMEERERALIDKFRADLGVPGERTQHHLRRLRESVERLSSHPPAGYL